MPERKLELETDKEFYKLQDSDLRKEMEKVRNQLSRIIGTEDNTTTNEDILKISKRLDELIVRYLK